MLIPSDPHCGTVDLGRDNQESIRLRRMDDFRWTMAAPGKIARLTCSIVLLVKVPGGHIIAHLSASYLCCFAGFQRVYDSRSPRVYNKTLHTHQMKESPCAEDEGASDRAITAKASMLDACCLLRRRPGFVFMLLPFCACPRSGMAVE